MLYSDVLLNILSTAWSSESRTPFTYTRRLSSMCANGTTSYIGTDGADILIEYRLRIDIVNTVFGSSDTGLSST